MRNQDIEKFKGYPAVGPEAVYRNKILRKGICEYENY